MKALTDKHLVLIQNALQKVTGKTEWDTITPLTLGMSGASIYEVEVDYTFYVARISSQNHWGSELKTEFTNMQIASHAEVSPHVYVADPDNGIVLMKYVNSQPLTQLTAGNRHDVESLAHLLASLHGGKEFSSGLTFFQISRRLIQHLSSEQSTHPLVSQSGELLASLETILSDPNDMRPSHRDINPYNLLFNGNKYYLVDWEAAAQDNLYLDLAMCVNYYFYDNEDAARCFLETYFGKSLSDLQQYKLHLMRVAALIYLGTNFLLLATKSAQAVLSSEHTQGLPSYAEYAKLIGFTKNLADPVVQQEYGFVCFKQMMSLLEHPTYDAAMSSFGCSVEESSSKSWKHN